MVQWKSPLCRQKVPGSIPRISNQKGPIRKVIKVMRKTSTRDLKEPQPVKEVNAAPMGQQSDLV